MGRFVQLVMGPAGVGKSTYCKTMQEHCAASKRQLHVANLDPAAEYYDYEAAFDIKELINLEDVMTELNYGPNGGLIYCMEYLMQNNDWLKDELDNFAEDEYVVLDCPGQVELYSHLPFMHDLARQLTMWGYNVVTVYLLDALCVLEPTKFISGCLLSLSCMLQLELPHVNVVTKCDLVNKEEIENILESENTSMVYRMNNRNRENEAHMLLNNPILGNAEGTEPSIMAANNIFSNSSNKHHRLTEAIGSVVDDYMMVSFVMMDPNDEDTLENVLFHMDNVS